MSETNRPPDLKEIHSGMTPRIAMAWALNDHEIPELGLFYGKHEQVKTCMRLLHDNGYVIARYTDLKNLDGHDELELW